MYRIAMFLLLLPMLGAGSEVSAQTDKLPQDGGITHSLGMPPIWKGNAGGSLGWYDPKGRAGSLNALVHVGIAKDLLSPIAGIARIHAEAYGGVRGAEEFDGGGQAVFSIPSLHVGAGADYNIPDNDWSFLLRVELPMRRSGIFGRGTRMRFDWLPNRGNTFAIGVDAPLWGSNIGKTRPQRDSFELEHPPIQRVPAPAPSTALDEAVAQLRHGAQRIAEMSMPLLDHGGANPTETYAPDYTSIQTHWAVTDAQFPQGHTLNEEIRVFHETVDQLFSIAVAGRDFGPGESSVEGRVIADLARRSLVDHVLLPYNRLLGQRKAHDGLDEFAASGHAEFSRDILPRGEIADAAFPRVFHAFQTLTDIAEEIRAYQLDRWEDSRFVWLPLHMGLRPEDHDTQEEINSLIERAVERPFETGNRIWYTINEEFQLEFARSVLRAEDYHVLWIHDFRGKNAQKQPDRVGFQQTVHAYIQALTDRVRAYDETGKLPQYFIFLDQNYFEANDTRLYFRVLTDPMHYRLDLPDGYEEWEADLEEAQAALRDAVANSRLLQSEARQFGDEWLDNQIKVQINITNPVDHSFLSSHVAGIIAVPDNVIRDHRKIAFYDITEDDPYRGMSMYTGMGIGEHYAGRNWEDRAIIIQGPTSLAVKDAARDLLESQGFQPEQIPFPLRRKPLADNYLARRDSMVADMVSDLPNHVGEALELHNLTGYAPKPIDVKKAIMYSLMPPGSVLKVPDSLWQSYVYGSLLMGSSLRGCRVLVIAPSLASAPSSAPPTMARAHGLFSGMIVMKNALDEEIRSQGGLFKTGLYAPKVGVGDVEGRIRQAQGIDVPWLREVYPFNPAMAAAVDSVGSWLEDAGYHPDYLTNADSTAAPKLHMKANFFVTGEAWDFIMRRSEWGPLMREYFMYLAAQTGPVAGRPAAFESPAGLRAAALDLARSVQADFDPEVADRAFAYFTMGSTNLNYRSMVLDGEVEITVTGWDTLAGLVDFLLIAGLSEWVEDLDHLDALLPPPSGFTRSLANLIKVLL